MVKVELMSNQELSHARTVCFGAIASLAKCRGAALEAPRGYEAEARRMRDEVPPWPPRMRMRDEVDALEVVQWERLRAIYAEIDRRYEAQNESE